MGTAHEPIIRGKNHHRVLLHSVFPECRSYHSDGNIDRIDLLVIGGHDLVIPVRVVPTIETLVLAPMTALRCEVKTILPAKISWLHKAHTSINSLI